MKKVLIVLFVLPVLITAQNINGRFSSSLYSFERFDTQNSSETYIRSFQSLALNVNKDMFSLRTRLNYETNLSNTLDNDPRLRFYNLYLEARDIFDIATLRIGRQSLINSVAGGTYDGVNLKLKYDEYKLTGFFGGNVPAYQKLELTDDWSNDYVMGANFETTVLENFRFEVGYIDKNYAPVQYNLIRLDEELLPDTLLYERSAQRYKFLSGGVSFKMTDVISIYTHVDYDLNFVRASKVEASASYNEIENLGINIYYNYRQPRIPYNSIFSVFNYSNTQEIEGGIDYKFDDQFSVYGKFGTVTYEDDNSQRLSLGINTVYGNLSYRKTFGYAGELDAISLYTARSFMEGFLTPSIGLSYSSYKLSEDQAKANTLLTVLAGVNVRPWRTLSFDLQGHFMNNKIYKNDLRILVKINYWFNNNLDLF